MRRVRRHTLKRRTPDAADASNKHTNGTLARARPFKLNDPRGGQKRKKKSAIGELDFTEHIKRAALGVFVFVLSSPIVILPLDRFRDPELFFIYFFFFVLFLYIFKFISGIRRMMRLTCRDHARGRRAPEAREVWRV